MAISQNFPNTPPSLLLDFAKSKKLDSRITFTRGSTGTYVDNNGLIRTAGINEARFDHDPNTLKSLGLLIEESRTNLLLQSTTPDNLVSPWIKGPNTTRVGVTTSPDGTNTAVYYSGDGSGSNEYVGQQSISLSSNTTYTVSIWAKIVSGSAPTSGQIITTEYDNGSTTVRSFIDFNGNITTEWKRFTTTFTNVNSGTFSSYFIADQNNTAEIAIWGAQLEAGKEATSYIPTAGSTVTRSIDVAYIDGTSFTNFYNQTEGTLFTSVTYNATPISGVISRTSASIGGGVGFIWQMWWEGASVLSTFGYNGSSYDLDMRGSSIPVNTSHKLITAYETNDCAFCQDGGTVVTDTSALINTDKTTLRIGDLNGSHALSGRVSQLTYYPRRLSNTYLQELTK